jgi:hypothetical protein
MSTELQPYNPGALEESAMSPEGIKQQVALIQSVMKSVMKEKVHYDTIPGTDKPTLLQPGADKLNLTFRLGPEYHIVESIRQKDFIAYTVRCDLLHIPSGNKIACGFGSCNSREAKYRYRSQNTGRPVPQAYWQNRDQDLLGGPQYSPRKKDGKWVIYEQVEHDNPWDNDNTLLKMACKRAKVAATLNATAAHDIFTQDLEDMTIERETQNGPSQPTQERPRQNPTQHTGRSPGAQQGPSQGQKGPSQKQIGAIHSMCQKLGKEAHEVASYVTGQDIQSLSDLTGKQASEIISAIQSGNVPADDAMSQMDEQPF